MRIALLTEGAKRRPKGDPLAWCDRLVRGLTDQEFEVYALCRDPQDTAERWAGRYPGVRAVYTRPLWGPAPGEHTPLRGRPLRRRFLGCYRELVATLTARPDTPETPAAPGSADLADRFANSLYGLAELAREHGGLPGALRSEPAVQALEAACRAPGAAPLLGGATVHDLLTASESLERALRPLSAPWYGETTLGGVDLCHATSGGPATLPGLLAAHFCGTPLLVTEYGVRLREHYLDGPDGQLPVRVRVLLAALHRRLATESYRAAALLTPGNGHIRRWQERCGAPRTKIRTVHPGIDAGQLAAVGEAAESGAPDADDPTLVWVGRVEPAKDLVALLHAFARIHTAVPRARLRIISGGGRADYLAQCRVLAAQLFPDEAADSRTPGESPVTFEEIGSPYVPTLADAYAAGGLVVLSSVVEGFPATLVEAMFCARATVSTDVGAVREVIGGTGLVVPPRNPTALAEACTELLHDPHRRARLGAAARARALELFTAEQNVAAFREIYLDLVAHRRPAATRTASAPFALPAEAHLPGSWRPAPGAHHGASRAPAWAREAPRQPAVVGAPAGLPLGENA
ncbi:glycosyltransferase [Streptantibioticus ferralitis]|uniref:D-inositol 3-phosphate glycosyltransferase n=1 Tax=Streptantibioticus ferralitis TaxID=236510 RepID=A0ABT5YSR7_9ACTN|nr:glycosyltransferase [Streptantibioticus ferralitis]MDF2254648.1 glycosyltransferase [Streptantibioticus ferralitis]